MLFVFKLLHIVFVNSASKVMMQKYIDTFYIASSTFSLRNISD